MIPVHIVVLVLLVGFAVLGLYHVCEQFETWAWNRRNRRRLDARRRADRGSR